MQLTAVLVAALSLAATSIAAPVPIDTADIDITSSLADNLAERAAAAEPLIDLWEGKDFLEIKFTGSAALDECKNFGSKQNDVFQSGKAKKGKRCTIWVDKNCKGTGFSFNQQGKDAFPSWINKKASSWKCVNL